MKMKFKIILLMVGVVLCCSGYSSTMEKVYSKDSKIIPIYDTYSIDNEEVNIEEDSYSGNLILSGSLTIWEYDCEEDKELDISYLLSVSTGKAKIVLITPDEKISEITMNEDQTISSDLVDSTLSLKVGNNRIKIVGKDKSNIDVVLNITEGTFK